VTTCSHCGEWRERDALLLVTDLATGETRYLCRPSVSPECFRLLRDVTRDRIEAA
jgi:hypothetical protein